MRSNLVSAWTLAALAAVFVAGVGAAPDPSADSLASTQLPRGIMSSHYDISVVPDAASLTFEGNATVNIDVLEPTRSIMLNALDMTFSSVRLASVTGEREIDSHSGVGDAAAQTATFTFPDPVPAGEYRLAMSYSGKIGTQATGLFAIDCDTERTGNLNGPNSISGGAGNSHCVEAARGSRRRIGLTTRLGSGVSVRQRPRWTLLASPRAAPPAARARTRTPRHD